MGQTCVCTNRIFAQAGIHDAFVARLAEGVAALRVGNGAEPGIDQGPLINAAALRKVEAHVEDALIKGATLHVGGAPHPLGGTFYQPTVLSGLTESMRIASEETFGPVAGVFRFEAEREAIALANATETGLAAYAFTRDNGRVFRLMEALEYGIVG